MFRVLQAHEETEPKAVLKTQSKRAQKRLLRAEARKQQELPEGTAHTAGELGNEVPKHNFQSEPGSKCDPASYSGCGHSAAHVHEKVLRRGDVDSGLLNGLHELMRRVALNGSAYEDGALVAAGMEAEPRLKAPSGGLDGRGGGGRSEGGLQTRSAVPGLMDLPPGPGPGSGHGQPVPQSSAEPLWPGLQVTSVRISGRHSSLPLKGGTFAAAAAAAAAAASRSPTACYFGCSLDGHSAHSGSSPACSCTHSPGGLRSPPAPGPGDMGDFPELKPAASAPVPWPSGWAAGGRDEDVASVGGEAGGDGAGQTHRGAGAGGGRAGAAGKAKGSRGHQRSGGGARHGRIPASGIKVLNKAQPHPGCHHHHYHQQHGYTAGRAGMQRQSSPMAGGAQRDAADLGGGDPGEENLALLWHLLQDGLYQRADPLAGGDGAGPEELLDGPDPDVQAVIRRAAQAQCEQEDGPARGVTQEQMIEMMTRATRRHLARRAAGGSRAGAGTGETTACGSEAAAGGGYVAGVGSRSRSGSDDEDYLYLDKDDSKSWRKTMEWMERNDWVRMPDGKHFKFRRMLPGGKVQTQTVCCTPSDAMRGIRNLQAELARKDTAANQVIRSWRQEQRQKHREAAEAAAAAEAALE